MTLPVEGIKAMGAATEKAFTAVPTNLASFSSGTQRRSSSEDCNACNLKNENPTELNKIYSQVTVNRIHGLDLA